jgi:hypothetical protein
VIAVTCSVIRPTGRSATREEPDGHRGQQHQDGEFDGEHECGVDQALPVRVRRDRHDHRVDGPVVGGRGDSRAELDLAAGHQPALHLRRRPHRRALGRDRIAGRAGGGRHHPTIPVDHLHDVGAVAHSERLRRDRRDPALPDLGRDLIRPVAGLVVHGPAVGAIQHEQHHRAADQEGDGDEECPDDRGPDADALVAS